MNQVNRPGTRGIVHALGEPEVYEHGAEAVHKPSHLRIGEDSKRSRREYAAAHSGDGPSIGDGILLGMECSVEGDDLRRR